MDFGMGDLFSGMEFGDAGFSFGDMGGAVLDGGSYDFNFMPPDTFAMDGSGAFDGGDYFGKAAGDPTASWNDVGTGGGDAYGGGTGDSSSWGSGSSGGGGGGGGGWGGSSGGGFLSTLGRYMQPLLGGVGGSLLGMYANSQAANARSNASTQAAAITAQAARDAAAAQVAGYDRAIAEMRGAADRGTTAIRQGVSDYEATVQPLLTPRPIMFPTYRGLTDAEQIARGDIRRNALATLAASGLRGAGRAGVATVMDQDRRFVTQATQNNDNRRLAAMQDAQRRADGATSALAGVRAGQGTQIANIEIGQGNRVAATEGQIGGAQAQGIATAGGAQAQNATNQGNISAGETTANATLGQDALGSLGSVIADSLKSGNREKYSSNDRWV